MSLAGWFVAAASVAPGHHTQGANMTSPFQEASNAGNQDLQSELTKENLVEHDTRCVQSLAWFAQRLLFKPQQPFR